MCGLRAYVGRPGWMCALLSAGPVWLSRRAPARALRCWAGSLVSRRGAGVTRDCVSWGQAGLAVRAGALMVEAQAEFDARATPLCPEQLAAPLLHRVLAHPPVAPLTFGRKGVGSQVPRRCACDCRPAGSPLLRVPPCGEPAQRVR
jgi:hypothetical protein